MPDPSGGTEAAGALDGVFVLDLSRILAGPYCTQLLADLGATVVKVESPHGDDTRSWGPPFEAGESAYFLSINRGKRSLALDLKHPDGRRVARRLADRADVIVENFKAGDLARYDLDYESVERANPGVVYASITGYGLTGPRSAEPGYDAALQGMSGIMSLTGRPDGPPTKVGVAWIDILTGLHAAVGILAALHERSTSGRGQHLDVALFDVAVASLANQAQAYLLTGEPPARMGNAHPQIVPYEAFETQDGWLMLAAGNDEQFRRACDALELPELALDPRFMTNALRVREREALVGALRTRFRERPRDEWLERLRRMRVPVTPVNDVAQALEDPQSHARSLVWELEHPTVGSLRQIASPLRFLSRTPARPAGAPPRLGEHTDEVLRDVLGMEETERAALRKGGALGASRAAASEGT